MIHCFLFQDWCESLQPFPRHSSRDQSYKTVQRYKIHSQWEKFFAFYHANPRTFYSTNAEPQQRVNCCSDSFKIYLFVANAFNSQINTQIMHIKSTTHTTALLCFPEKNFKLYPGRIRGRVFCS
jgi:hypothetical protein